MHFHASAAYGGAEPVSFRWTGLVDISVRYKFIVAAFLTVLAARATVAIFNRLRARAPIVNVKKREVSVPRDTPRERTVFCYDPATRVPLGTVLAMTETQVQEKIAKARIASEAWKLSSFKQRRLVLRTLLQFITDNQDEICRVSARDSGKPILDAAFGELTVTCEKICWLLNEGERWLRPEYRSASRMMFYKSAMVEYHPVGVVGAIVPWNYPFHNILNPLVSAIFAGNAIIIKASEHASWSAMYYGQVIDAVLAATGAPENLVQIVTGYAEAGEALVRGGVDKLVFVGSSGVGKRVMAAAADTLTPVVLELGGKDPIIICKDADIDHAVAATLRGTFQNNGQNCAGCERVLIDRSVYDKCVQKLAAATRGLRQGPPLVGDPGQIDAGALALPGLAERVIELIQDAVSHGAKVIVGGEVTHPGGAKGDFVAPTVLTGVTREMRIWREEVFGPVMVIVPFDGDDDAILIANDCAFGLGANIFTRSTKRADHIGHWLHVGLVNVNDFATSYMCQSLPWGGVKESGFDKFGGVEGLRGVCTVKAVCRDRFPWLLRTDIPRLLQYPTKPDAFAFQTGLIRVFYAPSLASKARGLAAVLKAVVKRS